ncbi:MAG: peptidoglycan DD-metalloendopeptidase family protein, partial [Thermoanaerobaculia bacterium]
LAALLLLLLAVASTWSFFFTTIDKAQLAQLEAENLRLREVNQDFETSVRELNRQLVDFEDRTRQLAIVAGVDGLGLEQDPGIGGEDLLLSDPAALSQLRERADFLDRGLESVGAELAEQLQQAAATPSISPVRGLLTSGYGYRSDPVTGQRALHRAIDISTSPGQPVKATADGIVLRARRNGRLGNSVDLSHGYGVMTRYGHLASYNVEPGQRVRRGDVIGFVGNTGRTTGFHLHYEVRLDGQPRNPLTYILDKRPSSS